tara:strand:- start:1478 stop:3205 length:1728 start_codon:yes stop_codon:yes gene_type:complete
MPSKKLLEQYQEKLETKQLWFGEIKQTMDKTRNGRMKVLITDITGSDTSERALFDCIWTSPFAGATQLGASTDEADADASQTSYGMWMRPPDPGTQVVVGMIEINGIKEPVILSCLFHSYRNFMVPGIPASNTPEGVSAASTEVNINNEIKSHNVEYTHKGDQVTAKSEKRPRSPLADALFNQGLSNDFVRGQSTSGARREDNSEVYGILTPGSRKDGNPFKRNPGHQFVMDDNDLSSLIRLRTGQGMQILLNDTNDLIYIVNKRGTGYIEIDSEGNIDFFGKGSFNVRTMGDLNLRADQNVNIEAGQDVNILAANNAPHPFDEGRGLGGLVDDPEFALENPATMADFLPVLKNGTVNIEGYKDVNIVGQDVSLTAFPKGKLPTGALQSGLQGTVTINATDTFRIQASEIIGDAIGRTSQGVSKPGLITLNSLGVTDIRGQAQAILHSPARIDIESNKVDIATAMTPPIIRAPMVLEAKLGPDGKFRPLTLFGFDLLPLPVPLPTEPSKQVQGKTLTGLGKKTSPAAPPIPIHDGLLPIPNKGVRTIVTRMPQPEPSQSKGDKPFKGGFKNGGEV